MKIFSAISLALILSATASFAKKNPAYDKPVDMYASLVNYVVRVENTAYLNNTGKTFLVMMTDATGNMVAPAQVYRPVKADYGFFERGPVRGTRVARMIQIPEAPDATNIIPSAKTGSFYTNTSYLFIVRPLIIERPAGNDIQ